MRDNFSKKVIEILSKRASFICSNPGCRCMCIAPSLADPQKIVYTGEAAHITAAAVGGARYDESLTSEQRESIDNAIFLCASCARMIDKNQGKDYPVDVLKTWKSQHENWVNLNLNKRFGNLIGEISGEHSAKGVGKITGLDIKRPVIIKPGTKSTAEGSGEITATRIG